MAYSESQILLVNPPGGTGWNQETDGKYFFPIGLLYLQNYLLRHRFTSTIIDSLPQGLSDPTRFREVVSRIQPKIIGFTGSPFERHTVHDYIRGIKKYAQNALIVAGGPYFAATARDCLTHLKDIDVIVIGEGEITFHEVVQALVEDKSFAGIDGIIYRDKSGNIVRNRKRSPANRDECEIDIDLLRDNDTYSPYVYLKNFHKEKVRALPILLARGCTKKCTYCFNNNNGRFTSRSVSLVIKEIQLKRERFNCEYFWMVDPTFTLRSKFARELCSAIIRDCPGIKWYCETRADCSLDLLGLMARAGCVSIDFALESGSPKVLKAIQKDLSVTRVPKFAEECKKLGMRALVFVMYSLPEESYSDFLQTMDVLYRIKPYIYNIEVNDALIFPGTQMEQQARELGILPKQFSWFNPSRKEVPRWKSHMSEDEIAKCKEQLVEYIDSLR